MKPTTSPTVFFLLVPPPGFVARRHEPAPWRGLRWVPDCLPDDLDESESAGIGIADTLPIGGKAEVYNTGGVGVNLRTGPGTGYSVLLTVPEGDVVDVLAGPSSSFYKVRYAGKEGWSHMSYLRPSSGGGTGGAYPSGIKVGRRQQRQLHGRARRLQHQARRHPRHGGLLRRRDLVV